MYKSRPSNSKGVYGLTLVIVGMLDLTKMVGIICTIPPIKIATVANNVNCTGLRSNQV